MGAMVFQTTYSNIKKIKVKHSWFCKNKGTVKIYVKKGLSLNYHLEGLNNVDEIYQAILDQFNLSTSKYINLI